MSALNLVAVSQGNELLRWQIDIYIHQHPGQTIDPLDIVSKLVVVVVGEEFCHSLSTRSRLAVRHNQHHHISFITNISDKVSYVYNKSAKRVKACDFMFYNTNS